MLSRSFSGSRWIVVLATALVGCTGTLGGLGQEDDESSSSDRLEGADGRVGPAVLEEGQEYVPTCDATQHDNAPIRLLTPVQLQGALAAALADFELDLHASVAALPPATSVAGFSTNGATVVGDQKLASLIDLAGAVAEGVVANFEEGFGCAPDRACVERFVDEVGGRLLRGHLPPAERDSLLDLYEDAGGDDSTPRAGLRRVVMGLVLSAGTLYQSEDRAQERRALSGRELASKLSLLLWNTIPDAELLEAASDGRLETEAGLRSQVERMLDDPRTERMMTQFYAEWLGLTGMNAGETTTLDEATTDAVIQESVDLAHFITFGAEGGTFMDLFSSRRGFVSDEVAELYGVEASEERGVELPEERAGLMVRAGFLAASSHLTDTAPTIRGQQVRQRLLCQTVPSPPADVQDLFPELPDDPDLTKREKLELHQAPSCSGCHLLLDPIGFSFEAYDEVGRYRSEYAGGQTVDQTGEIHPLTGEAGELVGPFDGPAELGAMISESQNGRDCFVAQWFQYALLRRISEEDACAFEQVRAGFHNSGYSLRELLVSLVTSPTFVHRNPD